MRPWLVLTQAGLDFQTETLSLPHMMDPAKTTSLTERRKLGSVRGLFPVLTVQQEKDGDSTAIHESLAICEYIADLFPDVHLWPDTCLDRARARAICCEMMTGFMGLRNECSCALFARVPSFQPSPAAVQDMERIWEIWTECLESSGGPFLFGQHFGIADAMYYPVITRFRTYGIELPTPTIEAYVQAVEATPAVTKLVQLARNEPGITVYDDYIQKLGGDPNKALQPYDTS